VGPTPRRPNRVDTLRAMLEARRHAVQSELDQLSHDLRAANPREGEDEADRANQAMQRELDARRIQQIRQTLQHIGAALRLHAAGDYGQCVACGTDIPAERLQSLPMAQYCRSCQEEWERGRVGP
jgi:DnaK suppressor protein